MSALAQTLTEITPQPTTSLSDWQALTEGHETHFVGERLFFLLTALKALNPSQLLLWYRFMLEMKIQGRDFISLSHRNLEKKHQQLSESGVRHLLKTLEFLGFLEIEKHYTIYGKQYRLRPSIPVSLQATLKAELDRCRAKSPSPATQEKLSGTETAKPSEPGSVSQQSANQASLSVVPKEASPMPEETLLVASEPEVHLDWQGQQVPETEVYLPEPAASPAPYQPRQDRAPDWVPSLADLAATVGPEALPPKDLASQRLCWDVADWTLAFCLRFPRERYEASGSSESYLRFFMKNPQIMKTDLEVALAQALPEAARAWIPSLLLRKSAYESRCASVWFSKTQTQLQEALEVYQAKQGQAAPKIRSPKVALSLPQTWYLKILKTAQKFGLSSAQVLELAYHLLHFRGHKTYPNLEEQRKYHFDIAKDLLRQRRWNCPKGLTILRTRHAEGAGSC